MNKAQHILNTQPKVAYYEIQVTPVPAEVRINAWFLVNVTPSTPIIYQTTVSSEQSIETDFGLADSFKFRYNNKIKSLNNINIYMTPTLVNNSGILSIVKSTASLQGISQYHMKIFTQSQYLQCCKK